MNVTTVVQNTLGVKLPSLYGTSSFWFTTYLFNSRFGDDRPKRGRDKAKGLILDTLLIITVAAFVYTFVIYSPTWHAVGSGEHLNTQDATHAPEKSTPSAPAKDSIDEEMLATKKPGKPKTIPTSGDLHLGGVRAFLAFILLQDLSTYALATVAGDDAIVQAVAYVAINIALAPFHAVITQQILSGDASLIQKPFFSPHINDQSYLELTGLLALPMIVYSIARIAACKLILPEYYKVIYAGPSSHQMIDLIFWLPGAKMIATACFLIVLPSIAISRAEAALVPEDMVTTYAVDRKGLKQSMDGVKDSSVLRRSAALCWWSWSTISLEAWWRSMWKILVLGFFMASRLFKPFH